MKRSLIAITVAFVVAAQLAAGPAHGASTGGTIDLSVSVPEGGTALIEIDPVNSSATPIFVVHHPDDGLESVQVPRGTYRITPHALTVDGTRFVAAASPRQVEVSAKNAVSVSVPYVESQGVQNLTPTEVTTTTIGMDWDAALGDDTVVWRVEGGTPTLKPGKGSQVPLDGSSFLDSSLSAGTTYSYSIFARPGDGKFGNLDGDPVTFTVGTLPEEGSASPSFIAAPHTMILRGQDVASVQKPGSGVLLTLAAGVDTPRPGSILSLPVSDELEGGYLGEVVDVSADGRTVLLTQASLSMAFDFYHLPASNFDESAAAESNAAPTTPVSGQQSAKAQRDSKNKKPTVAASTIEDAISATTPATAKSAPMAAAAAPIECQEVSNGSVTPHFSLSHAGHAEVTVDKYKIWFVEVPSGVGIDLGYSVTATGTVDVHLDGGVACGFPLPKYSRQITAYPVPIAVMAEPIGEVTATAGVSVDNIGMTTTVGFEAAGHVGFTGDNFASGSPILTANPTQPNGTGDFTIGLQLGGAINFGPGVGTSSVGLIAGLGGEISVADLSLSGILNDEGDVCVKLDAQSGFGVYLVARAWTPVKDWDYRLEIDALSSSFPWGGSPWHWPNDCEEDTTPTDDVVGPGVSVIGDDLTGSDEQWGKTDGFVPGESTWVLSTGRVADDVGPPSSIRSTSGVSSTTSWRCSSTV